VVAHALFACQEAKVIFESLAETPFSVLELSRQRHKVSDGTVAIIVVPYELYDWG